MRSYLDWVESANDISVTARYSLKVSKYLRRWKSIARRDQKWSSKYGQFQWYASAEINVQGERGNTPLHYVSANGKKDVVKYLLEKEADISIVNAKEQLVIDYSNIKGFNEITKLILETKGAKPPTSIAATAVSTESGSSAR